MDDGAPTVSNDSMILTLIGMLTTLFAGIMAHFYSRLNDMDSKIVETVQAELEGLRSEVRDRFSDLKRTVEDLQLSRLKIAENMVTRDEFSRQMDRVMAQLVVNNQTVMRNGGDQR